MAPPNAGEIASTRLNLALTDSCAIAAAPARLGSAGVNIEGISTFLLHLPQFLGGPQD